MQFLMISPVSVSFCVLYPQKFEIKHHFEFTSTPATYAPPRSARHSLAKAGSARSFSEGGASDEEGTDFAKRRTGVVSTRDSATDVNTQKLTDSATALLKDTVLAANLLSPIFVKSINAGFE